MRQILGLFAVCALVGCALDADDPRADDPAAGDPGADDDVVGDLGGAATAVEIVNGHEAAAGQVIVRFAPAATARSRADFATLVDAVQMRPLGDGSLGLALIHSRKDAASLLRELDGHPDLLYAEPNYLVHAMDTPNDPRFGELWGLHNTGQTVSGQAGTPDADIDAVEAWDLTTGSSSVVVGVVDTGVDYTHPDLAANIWSAPAAFTVNLAGQSLTCPQGSHGIRSLASGGGGLSCDPMDDNNVTQCSGGVCFFGRHGTHVSGTIGARGDNGQGVAGVNWTTQIMGVKFLNFSGGGFIEDAINAIEFAIQAKQRGVANVRVLNNSWGGGGFSQALLDVVEKANDNGILFVASAGNANSDNDVTPVMPGGFTAPNSVNVAATDNRDAKASFSSFGASTVHLGAPGVGILSTVGRAGVDYHPYNGTSMASPHVAGAAALILAACPGLDTAGLKSTILNNVDAVSSMADITISGGRLNVNRAVQACSGPFYVTAAPAVRNIGRNKTTTYAVTVGVNDFAGTVSLSISGLPSGTSASFNPSSVAGGGSSTLTVTTGAATPLGSHTLAIKGTSGSEESTTTVVLEVANPNFSVAASPAARLVNPGTSTTYSVDISSVGSFAGVVGLSTSGLPAGTTASFSPPSVTGSGSSTLTVNTSSTTPEGVFTLTVRGTSGALVRSSTVTMEVRRPTFTYTISPLSTSLKRGFARSYLMSVTSQYNFSGTVTFSVSGVPSGATASTPSPATITPENPWSGAKSSVLHTSTATPTGTYTLTWRATGGGVTQTRNVTVTITP